MAKEIEDDLKLTNWLSIMTFDAYKYMQAGGEIAIEQTDNGMVLRLPGIDINTKGVNSKFRRQVASMEAERVEETTEA